MTEVAEVSLPGGGFRVALTLDQLHELRNEVNRATATLLGYIDEQRS